jgi:putative acetyltransferase
MTIRAAKLDDRAAILEVVAAAFSRDGRDPQLEVEVVERTWAQGAGVRPIELVAVEQELIVGHVLAAAGSTDGCDALAVAPLAVAPGRQRAGIGTALMTELLARATQAGWSHVLLLGDPRYYGRNGFEPAATYGIRYPPVAPGDPAFQIRILDVGVTPSKGAFAYCWEQDVATRGNK